jgi:hypothetical protein
MQTIAEKSIQSRINTAEYYENEKSDDGQYFQPKTTKDQRNKRLIIHYTHEQRLASSKKDFHHIWDNVFKDTEVTKTKLIVGNRNRRKTTRELVSKRPKQQSKLPQQKDD